VSVVVRIREGLALPGHPAATAAWLGFMVLIARVAVAEAPSVRSQASVTPPFAASGPCSDRAVGPKPIDDVALRPGGVLEGRVIQAGRGFTRDAIAGLPVTLLRGGQTVATATTDIHGRFTVWNLSGGLYRVVVDTADGPSWRFCRVWTFSGAPPHALNGVTVPLGERLLRGQSPFPVMGFPRAAAVAAIAAGAIAVPIIYHNVKSDDYIPASP